jgi:hypothetical protein
VDDFEAGAVTAPGYQSLMLPVLSMSSNEEVRFGDSVDRLADHTKVHAAFHGAVLKRVARRKGGQQS